MTKRQVRAFFGITLVLSDVVMAALAFLIAYALRLNVALPVPAVNVAPLDAYFGLMAVFIGSLLIVFFFARLYHLPRAVSRIDELYTVFGAVSIGAMMSVALSVLLFKNSLLELDFPRAMVIYAWLLTIVLVMLGRLLHHQIQARLQARGAGRDRALIIGASETGQLVLQKIKLQPQLGYEVVGLVTRNPDFVESQVFGATVLGSTDDLPRLIDEHHIDEVIIALPEATHNEILDLLARCGERASLSVKVFPDVFQILASQVSIDDLGGLPLLSMRDVRLRGWHATLKRVMDLMVSGLLLILLSPLLLFVALLVKLESPGPVFYAQERMGLDARPFMMLKFRSMRKDAEANGPGWTTPNDPRRTRLGAILRQLNVDELPQLINVLVGQMSLVGPRPERPHYVEQFKKSIPRYMERHKEKAGITGWAQVNGLRGDTSIAERTKYDLWYIENWSFLLDVKILARTVVRFLSDHNAY
ncbi:MAG TPA: undecaprenyl-phosphate glucose phosphotransferase [Anaerolineae bacterium]|nr:undecaprenyl-phosphate glucose phosphotransferase [Anaerolineae bacterium]